MRLSETAVGKLTNGQSDYWLWITWIIGPISKTIYNNRGLSVSLFSEKKKKKKSGISLYFHMKDMF